MQDGAGGGDIHLLLSILANGEEQARQLELGEPAGDVDGQLSSSSYPGGHRWGEEYYRAVARQLQCTFARAMAVARTIEAAAGGDRSDSPRSADESSGRTARDVVAHQERQDVPKRRKGLPRWTEKIRVPDANLEATPEDGFSWRKYGQKDILGAKFPRSMCRCRPITNEYHCRGYYRCTYRNVQGCLATKQVQRSDSDLCVFDVTYHGAHTCHQKLRHATSPPGCNPPPLHEQQDPSVELVRNFKNGLKVETDGLPAPPTFEHDGYGAAGQLCFPSAPFHAGVAPPPDDSFSPVEGGGGHLGLGGGVGCFSPAFVSPVGSAAGSSYFSMTPGYDYEQRGGPSYIQ
ncbi:hypothetical protein GUJ93_ZPchr0006g45579 [Zizania palustris]|uniref:WRKY domain-containing protein n=1 Tax=Zizania palustris TaxID=103762 RepID=A0A8J5VLX6_ZIZPA|nr:hypothetical protein GUJ93_ZPchr0006g45579 [Zizania palustris]